MTDQAESLIHTLVALRIASLGRYRENLAKDPKIKATIVTSEEAARTHLSNPDKRTDIFVVDNGIGNVFDWIKEVRQMNPRLLILLVDEEADFVTPGRADEVTTTPFKEDDMLKKIKRLAEERSLATLRADSLPEVRNFAKALRKATKSVGKQQAAVAAIKDLGFDHVIYYEVVPGPPPAFTLGAQIGPNAVMGVVPVRADYDGVLGHVAKTGESKIVRPGSSPSHFLIEKSRYAALMAVPVGTTLRFGVLMAFTERPDAVREERMVMIELICAQLASGIAKEQRS
jgi:hypothetical protein